MAKQHGGTPSPPPVTYTAREPLHGVTLKCTRCARVHAYPYHGGPAVRCECGWRYTNNEGLIEEVFACRLGV